MILNKANFVKLLNKNFIFEKNPTVAVGVSGGPDSMALIHLIDHWNKLQKGKVIALIIDHNLRTNSSEETKIIKNFLKKYNVKSKILTVNKNKINKRNMNEARVNRYDLLIDYCKKNKIIHLFVGHHKNDNLETFINRKISGSDFEGLNSIKLNTLINKTIIVRPLLNFYKNQIYTFNNINLIPYIEDPTNNNLYYTRPIIRRSIKEFDKHTFENLIYEFQIIQKNIILYNQMINELLIKNIINVNAKYITINYKNFIKLDELLSEKIVKKIYQFFFNKGIFLRSKKIQSLIIKTSDKNFKSYNLGGMLLKKVDNSLFFSKN